MRIRLNDSSLALEMDTKNCIHKEGAANNGLQLAYCYYYDLYKAKEGRWVAEKSFGILYLARLRMNDSAWSGWMSKWHSRDWTACGWAASQGGSVKTSFKSFQICVVERNFFKSISFRSDWRKNSLSITLYIRSYLFVL